MSEKSAKNINNSTPKKSYKWGLYVLIAIFLELLAIGGAVLICESKTKKQTTFLDKTAEQLVSYNNRITNLEKIPLVISQISSNVSENYGNIGLLQENLNSLKEEVGNKKMEILSEKLNQFSNRIERVEETKNREALILSIALLVKENVLYGRNASYEIDILTSMADEQDFLKESLDTLNSLKNKTVLTDIVLQTQFDKIASNFDFEKKLQQTPNSNENKGRVSKSIQMIKDTVAGINFDKVVVVKKDKKTAAQKEMLETLKQLVSLHHFDKAVTFINENPDFSNAENSQFDAWLEDVKNKVNFDNAISKIITTELNILREDIRNKTILPTTNKDIE